MNSVEQLTNEGFDHLTEWVFREDKIKPAELSWSKPGCNLYAFVVKEEVKYIGLTTMTLISRLDHYSYGKDSTSKRVRQDIKLELRRGMRVKIFGSVVANEDRLPFEERRLINSFRPNWNRA